MGEEMPRIPPSPARIGKCLVRRIRAYQESDEPDVAFEEGEKRSSTRKSWAEQPNAESRSGTRGREFEPTLPMRARRLDSLKVVNVEDRQECVEHLEIQFIDH